MVEILLWLVPAVLATGAAMALAAWLGRDRSAGASSVTVPVREQQRGPGDAVSRPRPARAEATSEKTDPVRNEDEERPRRSA